MKEFELTGQKNAFKGKRKQDLVVYTHGKRWILMGD